MGLALANEYRVATQLAGIEFAIAAIDTLAQLERRFETVDHIVPRENPADSKCIECRLDNIAQRANRFAVCRSVVLWVELRFCALVSVDWVWRLTFGVNGRDQHAHGESDYAWRLHDVML